MSVIKVEGESGIQNLTVTGLAINDATEKNVRFDWASVTGAVSYEVRVMDAQGKVIKTYKPKTDYYLEKKMSAGAYSFQVRAIDKNKKGVSFEKIAEKFNK